MWRLGRLLGVVVALLGIAAVPARLFKFDQIVDAHRLMDAGQADGKLVVETG